MKQFFEFIPLVIFFAIYKMVDIYAATASLIVTTGLMLAYNYFKHGKVEKMHLITFLMVSVFGGLTLILHDDLFIKWKVTAVYALFSIALLVSQFFFKKPIIKQMLGKELILPDNVWNNLNVAWAILFAALGILNIYVAFNLSQDVWVNFKVFGLLGVTLVFTALSGLYLYKYLPVAAEKETKE
ncbi:septation protein A [Psychromonas antarctica]|jgi:intracellular septation protein|uniref:septation protein A n=1 Tax=Psychromonas antarctica TaxID=67573 RepID=UPI001EE94329|nr:septation protein A [Psychromonas antarctica]MCG6200307.1 septation protein A [Psychromonas antarctica]